MNDKRRLLHRYSEQKSCSSQCSGQCSSQCSEHKCSVQCGSQCSEQKCMLLPYDPGGVPRNLNIDYGACSMIGG